MADILLAHCNHLFFDRKQARKMQPYPPLQTLLAAACLRARRIRGGTVRRHVRIRPRKRFAQALARHRPRLVVLCEDNFNFLTKMCLTRNRELAFFMCQPRRKRGLPVVVNSSDAIRSHLRLSRARRGFRDLRRSGADAARAGAAAAARPRWTRRRTIAGLAFRDPDAQGCASIRRAS